MYTAQAGVVRGHTVKYSHGHFEHVAGNNANAAKCSTDVFDACRPDAATCAN